MLKYKFCLIFIFTISLFPIVSAGDIDVNKSSQNEEKVLQYLDQLDASKSGLQKKKHNSAAHYNCATNTLRLLGKPFIDSYSSNTKKRITAFKSKLNRKKQKFADSTPKVYETAHFKILYLDDEDDEDYALSDFVIKNGASLEEMYNNFHIRNSFPALNPQQIGGEKFQVILSNSMIAELGEGVLAYVILFDEHLDFVHGVFPSSDQFITDILGPVADPEKEFNGIIVHEYYHAVQMSQILSTVGISNDSWDHSFAESSSTWVMEYFYPGITFWINWAPVYILDNESSFSDLLFDSEYGGYELALMNLYFDEYLGFPTEHFPIQIWNGIAEGKNILAAHHSVIGSYDFADALVGLSKYKWDTRLMLQGELVKIATSALFGSSWIDQKDSEAVGIEREEIDEDFENTSITIRPTETKYFQFFVGSSSDGPSATFNVTESEPGATDLRAVAIANTDGSNEYDTFFDGNISSAIVTITDASNYDYIAIAVTNSSISEEKTFDLSVTFGDGASTFESDGDTFDVDDFSLAIRMIYYDDSSTRKISDSLDRVILRANSSTEFLATGGTGEFFWSLNKSPSNSSSITKTKGNNTVFHAGSVSRDTDYLILSDGGSVAEIPVIISNLLIAKDGSGAREGDDGGVCFLRKSSRD